MGAFNAFGGDAPRIAPATAKELDEGLALVFGHLPQGERRARTDAARRAGYEVDGQLWLAREQDTLLGAVWIALEGPDGATLAEPRIAATAPPSTAARLLAAALASLEGRGVRWVQALVEPESEEPLKPFHDSGFRRVCDLVYLASEPRSFPMEPPRSPLEYHPCPLDVHPRLAAIVERTYRESLDCPAIDGARNVRDVLAGYRSLGAFDPARWLIVRAEGHDVGCLLLADHGVAEPWEIQYMGLAPEWRGNGWGLAMVRHAQWLARGAGCARLMLAVDANNGPALRIYDATGWIAWKQRLVLLKTLGDQGRAAGDS
jgi:GNAT superfamily N-acetyltransferase